MLTYYTLKKLREEREGKESQVQEQPMDEKNYEFAQEFAPQVEAQEQVEAEMNEQNEQAKYDEKPKKK